MFSPDLTKDDFLQLVKSMSAEEFARLRYCQELAGVFIAVSKFEDTLIDAMEMCNRIKIDVALGDDADKWVKMIAKRSALQSSTLGSLIKILERHNISSTDLSYLKWLKKKRDYFVHRHFQDGAWPGDMSLLECNDMVRRLLAVQLWLERGERNIWMIFERAGLLVLDRLGDGSILVMNENWHEILYD
jgi:hypothetical protein